LKAGDHLVISFGVSRPVVLNARTGVALPPLQSDGRYFYEGSRTAFSSDGRLLAVSGYAVDAEREGGPPPEVRFNTLRVWDTTTGRVLRSWNALNAAIGFHPSLPVLAVAEMNGDKTRLGIWDFTPQP
jgi:hypothetical protein